MKNLELAGLLLTQPRMAFERLREHPRFALPLWLLLIGNAAVVAWYYSAVDLEWFRQMILSGAQLNGQAPQGAMPIARGPILAISVIGSVCAILIIRLIEAGYYTLAGHVTSVQCTFRQWFAFALWVNAPQVLSLIPSFLLLLLGDASRMDPGALQPASLNELFFHRKMQEPGYSLLTSLNLFQVLVWWLTVLGVKVWSGRSVLFSAVFGLLPAVLVIGIWAAFSFR
ncbi:MAG: YIP1 family protein [Steroidobacteraceae bacterium]|nr:YIP1 family protein [Steroidobacteraceae bacterium]